MAKIVCNGCGELFNEEDLVKILETEYTNKQITTVLYVGQKYDETTSEIINGCPNCLTDGYLMDVK